MMEQGSDRIFIVSNRYFYKRVHHKDEVSSIGEER